MTDFSAIPVVIQNTVLDQIEDTSRIDPKLEAVLAYLYGPKYNRNTESIKTTVRESIERQMGNFQNLYQLVACDEIWVKGYNVSQYQSEPYQSPTTGTIRHETTITEWFELCEAGTYRYNVFVPHTTTVDH